MRILPKVALALTIISIAAFCSFGFLASYEPPGFPAYRWLYGTAGLICVVAVVILWLVNTARH
jgi:hypothetical protein